MKLVIKERFIELISHALIMFSVRHLQKDGSVSGGWRDSQLIFPDLSLPEICISST